MSRKSLYQEEFSYSNFYSNPLPFPLDIDNHEPDPLSIENGLIHQEKVSNSNNCEEEEEDEASVDLNKWFLPHLKTEIVESSPETHLMQANEDFGLYTTPTFDFTSTPPLTTEKSNDLQQAYQDLLIHTPAQIFPCLFCPYETVTVEALSTHVMSIHAVTRSFKCKYCDYSAKSKWNLNRHSLRHSKPDQNNIFSCEYEDCKYKTNEHWVLNKHMRGHLPKIKTVQKCSFCAFSTYQQEMLISHLQQCHPTPVENRNVLPYHCKYCPYKGAARRNLTRHMQLHSNEIALLKPRKNVKSQL